jgi:hypothetical protein
LAIAAPTALTNTAATSVIPKVADGENEKMAGVLHQLVRNLVENIWLT